MFSGTLHDASPHGMRKRTGGVSIHQDREINTSLVGRRSQDPPFVAQGTPQHAVKSGSAYCGFRGNALLVEAASPPVSPVHNSLNQKPVVKTALYVQTTV